VDRANLERVGPDPALEGRIESFELAFRMQSAAPELQDVSGESPATLQLYGSTTRPRGTSAASA
jgi:hypothetical protein